MSPIEHITQDQVKEFIAAHDTVVIDFTATWCPPCKKMAAVFEEIDAELDPPLFVGKVDIDENKEIARDLCIQYVPALMFFYKGAVIQFPTKPSGENDGEKPEVVDKIDGFMPKEDVLEIVAMMRKLPDPVVVKKEDLATVE